MSEFSNLVCSVSGLNNSPDNFHAGKTAYNVDYCKTLTSDPWAISSVGGVKIEVDRMFTQHKLPVPLIFNGSEDKMMNEELKKSLRKGIVEPTSPENGKFVSNIFPKLKKDGSLRIILNLKRLNEVVIS